MRPAAPLLMLAPALVLLPLLPALPFLVHGGGFDLLGRFALAALRPSLDPLVLRSALEGLAVSLAIALVGWIASLLLGVTLGLASARIVWRVCSGRVWPAVLIRRVLALPRAIHELLWGLLLLQLFGLEPMVAVLAIAIPFGALVARVVSDLLDALDPAGLEALCCGGARPGPALLTALGPPLLPGLLSYGGYRLECALRSATLLGVFGLGGLGTDLRLTLQSLEFRQLWTGLWLLLAAMLLLEAAIGRLRRRWLMPARFGLAQGRVGRHGREMLLTLAALALLAAAAAAALGLDPAFLADRPPLPPLPAAEWDAVLRLPWLQLVSGTLLLTLLAACLAVGLAPLLLLLAVPWPIALVLLRIGGALARLWPPPLIALLLLFVLQPGVITAALALGLHNLGILGRLLGESLRETSAEAEQALLCAGAGPRPALLHGRYSAVARSYLAYGAYRADVMLRESVVVGLVGAAGLGSQLMESLSAFAWDQVTALVAVYALLTLLGEDLSERLRQRLMGTG